MRALLSPGPRAGLAVLSFIAATGRAPVTASVAPLGPHAAVDSLADNFLSWQQEQGRRTRQRGGWPDLSAAARAENEQRVDAWVTALAAIPGESLTGSPQWVTWGMLRQELEASQALRACRAELWNVSPFSGWHLALGGFASGAPVGSAEARATVVARYRAFPALLAQSRANLEEGLALGYRQARSNVERVLEQLDVLAPADPAASPLMGPARRDSDSAFQDDVTRLVRGELYPALRTWRDWLAGPYRASARDDIGLGAIPGGAACYRAQLRSATSLDLDVDAMIARAHRERVALDSVLRPLLEQLVGPLPLPDAKRRVREDPRFLFATADEMLAAARENLARVTAGAPALFSRLPDVPLVVQPTPAYMERSDPPARYGRPGGPGQPGTFYLNTWRADRQSRMNAIVAVSHEGVPGHHLQQSWLAGAAPAHPVVQFLQTGAFVEGWGMYAERLADELGVFPSVLERVGWLMHFEDAWLALEIDPSLHLRGWTRAQAIDTIMAATGKPREVAASYADRHAATPAQTVSYMIGYGVIDSLRSAAQQALGRGFDVRAFHDQVLGDGPITLPMLRDKLGRWIAGGGRAE